MNDGDRCCAQTASTWARSERGHVACGDPVALPWPASQGSVESGTYRAGLVPGRNPVVGYWSPVRTDVMRWVLKPSQCMRPT